MTQQQSHTTVQEWNQKQDHPHLPRGGRTNREPLGEID
jgi:hypothetical protein